jgi:hypothetical protein
MVTVATADLPTVTCIYCRSSNSGVRFSREHVVPYAFCAGFRNVLVLHEAVCVECNQFFGDTIDLVLARDSAEGLARYRWQVKPTAEVTHFRSKLLEITYPGEGHLSRVPLRVVPADQPGGLGVVPRDGARMENATGEKSFFFTPDEIESGSWRQNSEVDWGRGVRLFGSEAVCQRMLSALEAQGVTFAKWTPIGPVSTDSAQAEVEETVTITPEIRRAFAKIAFNYLAWVEGPPYVLSPAFDPIRQYVRYGTQSEPPPVIALDDLPFLTNAPPDHRPVVHFVALGTASTHRNLIGTVMLFGHLSYNVVLADDLVGLWPELPRAHAYHVKTRVVEEMKPRYPRFRRASEE